MIDPVVFAEVSQAIKHLTDQEIKNRIKMIDNNLRQFRLEAGKIKQDLTRVNEDLKDNQSKIKQNKQLPFIVSYLVKILDMANEFNDDGAFETG